MDPLRGAVDELVAHLARQGLGVDLDCVGPMARRAGPSPLIDGALGWAASGLMGLTGMPGLAPLVPDGPVLARAQAAALLISAMSLHLGCPTDTDIARLLGGRAALMGLRRRGQQSANGSCRLLRAADGWIAVNLARPDDVDAVDALVGALGRTRPASTDSGLGAADRAWAALAGAVPSSSADDVVETARLLAIPAGRLLTQRGEGPVRTLPVSGARPMPSAGNRRRQGQVRAGRDRELLVVDLSAMWAGPLCAHLLGRAGMRVVKVESSRRPDGARSGDPGFYDWLHAGHRSVAVDFTHREGRGLLHRLVHQADVVIESSRPRALAQLGLDAPSLVAARPGKVWVSITGYGRTSAGAGGLSDPVAFGDDAAVAGGLVAWQRAGITAPVFCADAMADPLTGLFATVGVLASLLVGGGHLLDVPMRDVAAWAAAGPVSDAGRAAPEVPASYQVRGSDREGWTVHQDGQRQRVVPPRSPWAVSREGPARAATSGADTAVVLNELPPA